MLPGDLTAGRYGYYSMDRYKTAVNMIRTSGDEFINPEILLKCLFIVLIRNVRSDSRLNTREV